MNVIRTINNAIAFLEYWLIIISLAFMIFLSFFIVLLRSIYSYSHVYWINNILVHIDWAEPFVRLLVLWVAFLGASLLTQDNRHINIDILTSLLPDKWLNYRGLALSIVSGCVCIILTWSSVAYLTMEFEFQSSLFPGMPAWIGLMIIPLGFCVISFRFIFKALEQVIIIRKRGTH